MTNEQIAKKLGKKYETPCHGVGDCEFEAYQSAMEMAKWKDEEFWSFLNIAKIIKTYLSFDSEEQSSERIRKTIEQLKPKQ